MKTTTEATIAAGSDTRPAVAVLSVPALLGVRVAGRTVPPGQGASAAATTLAAT